MMTMFRELYALATSATLTMIVSADERAGTLTISVLPKPRKDVGEAALTKDLTLTASPEDFDAGFVQALQGYREVRASLMEQAEATCEVLEAARSFCAKKAGDAAAKASKPATTAKAERSRIGTGEPHADVGDDAHGGQIEPPAPCEPAPGESLQLFG
jgi:PRTRC genetic system protein E